uniref:class III lanthionine synthetase LanKC N-terminal domain-containing protein n=1 Tax=Apilactobacillus timberlakei TaxID=2008380 RepID=UPI0015E82C0E|nr:hypothetical protein [Apilactobacillus timberlakei]
MNAIDYNILSMLNIKILKNNNFSLSNNQDWMFITNNNNKIPMQGWKIHISSDPYDFITTLKKSYLY